MLHLHRSPHLEQSLQCTCHTRTLSVGGHRACASCMGAIEIQLNKSPSLTVLGACRWRTLIASSPQEKCIRSSLTNAQGEPPQSELLHGQTSIGRTAFMTTLLPLSSHAKRQEYNGQWDTAQGPEDGRGPGQRQVTTMRRYTIGQVLLKESPAAPCTVHSEKLEGTTMGRREYTMSYVLFDWCKYGGEGLSM